MKYLILFFTFQMNFAFGISEKNYSVELEKKILPFIKTFQQNYFLGQNKVPIHYSTLILENSKNCIVILPGRSESVYKYAELVFDLKDNLKEKTSFFLMDHRGQGDSGRMLKYYDRGHIDHFENYTLDLEKFLETIVLKQKCEKRYLVAHSLGAGISITYLLKHPQFFDKVVLNSPMLKIKTKPIPYFLAKIIVILQKFFGNGEEHALMQKGYTHLKFKNDNEQNNFFKSYFKMNRFTNSFERFKMALKMYEWFPKTQLGGVTNQFVNEVMESTAQYRERYKELKVPLMVFLAGDERYTEESETIKLCQLANNCKFFEFKSAKHEILMDTDLNRNRAINLILSFL